MTSDLVFVERPFMRTGKPARRAPRKPKRFGRLTYDLPAKQVREALISEQAHPPLAESCAARAKSNRPDYDAKLEPYWQNVRWARAYRLQFPAVVHSETAYVYARGRIMRESVIFGQTPYQDAKKRMSTWLKSVSWKTKKIESGIVLNTSREGNYYHLLHDFMTKIPYANDLGIPDDVPLIVSEKWAESGFGQQFLQSDLFKSRAVIRQPENSFLRCNDLYVLQPPQNCRSLLGRVADSFEMKRPDVPVSPNLMLQRGSEVNHRRLCKGYETLTEGLVRKGYQAIDPAKFTIPEQKWIFANASHVVGENGAAFGNMIFCDPRKVRIDALVTSKYATPTFQVLSSALGVSFTSHIVPSEIVGEEIHATVPQQTIDALLRHNPHKAG